MLCCISTLECPELMKMLKICQYCTTCTIKSKQTKKTNHENIISMDNVYTDITETNDLFQFS